MAASDGVRIIDIPGESNPVLEQPDKDDDVFVCDGEDDGTRGLRAKYLKSVERSMAERFNQSKSGGYKKYELVMKNGRLVMMTADHASGDITVGTDAIEADCAGLFGAVMPGKVGLTDSDVSNGVLSLTKNNSLNQLTTDLTSLTVELQVTEASGVGVFVPNLAIQITNSAALTLYVRLNMVGAGPGGADILSYLAVADAAGNELDACSSGEVNQVTVVGGCWTQAKFVAASPYS